MTPRKRLNNKDLPSGVYRHGRKFRMRIYIGAERRAAWHYLHARTVVEVRKEWAEYPGDETGSTVETLFERYEAEIIPTKAKSTQASDRAALKPMRAVFADMWPEDVRPKHVAAYLDKRAKTAPIRANREKALLSHVFSMAMRWGAVDRNPCRGVHRNPETPRSRYVTDSELRAAMKLAPPLLRYAMRMAYLTGLRRADILNLKLTDMTSDGIAVTVAKSRRPGSAPKRLLFEWSPELRTVVRKLRDMPRRIASVYLFATKFGTRITDSAFSTAWTRFQKRLEAASIERFQMKDLRAKHGSDIDEQGGDASRHLAHSSPATTRRHYLRKPAKITPIRRK